MKKKLLVILSAVLGAILLVTGSIAGTIAYLTSVSLTVKNTFTVGEVSIELYENDWDEYGENKIANHMTENTYKLIPGHTYQKDPTVIIWPESEACYVFVKVENGLSSVEVADADGDTIEEQILANGWEALDGQTGVYYKVQAAVGSTMKELAVFETFTLATNADFTTLSVPDNDGSIDEMITITAYAIQQDGFDGLIDVAWEALVAKYPDAA